MTFAKTVQFKMKEYEQVVCYGEITVTVELYSQIKSYLLYFGINPKQVKRWISTDYVDSFKRKFHAQKQRNQNPGDPATKGKYCFLKLFYDDTALAVTCHSSIPDPESERLFSSELGRWYFQASKNGSRETEICVYRLNSTRACIPQFKWLQKTTWLWIWHLYLASVQFPKQKLQSAFKALILETIML